MRRVLAIWLAAACSTGWVTQGAARADEITSTGSHPDRLDEHFTRARADLTAGKQKAARKQLGKAARQLEKRVHPATGEVKRALVKNAIELKRLSAEVDRGHVSEPRVVDASAGRAHAALAKFHQTRAEQRWTEENHKGAGRELRAAAHHLERGAVWLGRGADTAVRTATAGARVLSGHLVEGAGYAPEEVGEGIQAVGREIDRLGWKVEPRQGRPSPR